MLTEEQFYSLEKGDLIEAPGIFPALSDAHLQLVVTGVESFDGVPMIEVSGTYEEVFVGLFKVMLLDSGGIEMLPGDEIEADDE